MRLTIRRPLDWAALATVSLILAILIPSAASPDAAVPVPAQTQHPAMPATAAQFAKLPISFEANQGQTDSRVKFLSRGTGSTLFLTPVEAVLLLKTGSGRHTNEHSVSLVSGGPKGAAEKAAVLRIELEHANSNAKVSGLDELPGKSNYFIGDDPGKWRTAVSTYARVKYEAIYPGIDLVYHGSSQQRLEYDFVVAPGANPKLIELSFQGAERLKIDSRGNLVLRTAGIEVVENAPVIYQEIDGRRTRVAGSYALKGERRTGFRIAEYDRSRPLIIDPVLAYSTYLGASNFAGGGGAIAVDSSGDAYVTGSALSSNFPTTAGALQTTSGGSNNAFVSKLNSSGSALIYSTYLGGSNYQFETGTAITVDSSGNAYVTGITRSSNFPITPGALQTTFGGVFVSKLNSSGSALVYSTYLGGGGGSDEGGSGIALDSSGNAYVSGQTNSANFPTTAGALQTTSGGSYDAFISKLNGSGSALIYSTYLGGSNVDIGRGIAVDSSGNAYITGYSLSSNFPTTLGAVQTTSSGGTEAFVSKLNSSGSALIYSTYLGGGGDDIGNGMSVDSSGNAYVSGYTNSNTFPTTAGALQTTFSGSYDAFISKLNSSGSALVYSTYLGGDAGDFSTDIAVDSSGNAYVTGATRSSNFPTTAGAPQTTSGGANNAFVTKLNSSGSALLFSTYLSGSNDQGAAFGIAVDSSGSAYIFGATTSSNFPTTPGAFQTAFGAGDADEFVAKIAFGPLCSVTYNGTFSGNLNISSGLTCIIGGTVTGNVTENGGGLFTSNASIGGNLQITGGGTFSLASTAINGDLQIQNIPAGSAQNQICGTKVKGNLTFHNNGTAVAIGTASASCPGNTIGNDLQVNNNLASVQVFNDAVGGNLQCQSNSSIAGGGDTAKSLQGQCASF